jgi:hypothetical protein
MKRLVTVLLLMVSLQTNAALVERAGGAAFYDTVLNITWLADANYAATEDYGLAGISPQGQMDLATAGAWIDEMNSANYLGTNTWQLPVANPIDGVSYDVNFSEDGSTDRARNLSGPGSAFAGSTASQMANLYFNTLGNTSTVDVDGDQTACWAIINSNCLSNTGPFSNLENFIYWSGSASPTSGENFVFSFNGVQDDRLTSETYLVWAISNGDVLVPIPPALFLFPSALAALGWFRKRKLVRASYNS